ncbi:hypothetical protein ACFYQA_05620 [Streptomyces sp. NPDC005774]|uniref:hypothetical protein n=1 Tax=Streptomyces sp. NPDC005774 TaxID=3364728 RepID=UPI003692AC7A
MTQPSVHLDILDPSEVGPDDFVVGHTGGLPEPPDGVPWDGDVYVAGLDLAAIPEQPLELGLPREGQLLFFTNRGYDDGPAQVVHVPAGASTAVRPALSGTFSDDPSDTWTTDVLERRVLVCRTGTSWDVLDWLWDPDDEFDEAEGRMPDLEGTDVEDEVRPLLAAFTEYAERAGTVPFVHRTCGLRGVESNPPYYRADYGTDFLKKGGGGRGRLQERAGAVRRAVRRGPAGRRLRAGGRTVAEPPGVRRGRRLPHRGRRSGLAHQP